MNDVNDNQVEFTNKILFDNITFLLQKSNNKRIGDLERDVGVSPGYISRASKDVNARPSIEFVLRVANLFGVCIDTLLKTDLTQLTATEYYYLRFITKLIYDTNNNSLNWQVEAADYLNYGLNSENNENAFHPLFCRDTIPEFRGGDYPEQVSRVIFKSAAFDYNTYIAGNCFNVQLENGSYLFLMNVSKNDHNVNESNIYVKELWLWNPHAGTHFLCNTFGRQEISRLIEELFLKISQKINIPMLDKSVKDIIDAYMNEDIS